MDLSDLVVNTVIGFLVFKYLDQYLDVKKYDESKARMLKVLPFVMLTLTFIGQLTSIEFITEFIFLLSFCYVLWVLFDLREIRNVKNIFWLLGPYVVFSFYEIINQALKGQNDQTGSDIKAFLICWIIGFGIYLFNQNKKDRAKYLADENAKQLLEDRKNTLENIVQLRTAEITEQKIALENSMEELQATQSQLIHSEKMASLGELTAGIAHEIQNPLNFVNNFAELNRELIEELRTEQIKNTRDHESENQILEDIYKNLEKIIHHGKRADGIIKGMLQHSRKSTGLKEEINLNELADEYLRLAFHGLRAKDKTFNAQMTTNFDPELGKIFVVPQDIGRVLLNLITNAFYTVNEKKKLLLEKNEAIVYEPTVTVSTQRIKDAVVIKVIDNGNGMDEKIKEKIFQPFFTTKPTGQGTGLGLSMSYEIITKGHNGELHVESEIGLGTTFIITLPQ